MSFSMSQGSQASGIMMQQPSGSFRQYEGGNIVNRRNSAPQIYSAVYSTVDVYEMEVNGIAVMRRRKDSWLNATQILKVAGIEKGKRTKVLEKEILIGEHEKVQGGYGKYQGTWIKFERGLEFCRQYGVEEILRPLLTYDMGQDGGIAGMGGIDTPTKEQAMAAQRKKLYNLSTDNKASGQSGTFFKNISSTASHAVAAISKARIDSPAPRNRNANNAARPTCFSRQTSQQHLRSQDFTFPVGSQQSLHSFASAESFNISQQDSAYATQFSHQIREDVNGDFEEPPRKRMRPLSINDSQHTVQNEYMSMSRPDVSPTVPNDSFAYHPEQIRQMEGSNLPLAPLHISENAYTNAKKELLMSLFTNSTQADFSNDKAFQTLNPEDLDIPIDGSSNTALIWAATLARVELLRVLIAHGASIFRVNSAGETALMRSCLVTNNLEMGSFPEILELLGPTIEIRDSKGRTVLHHIAVASAVKGRSQASKYYLESLLEFIVRGGSASTDQSFKSGLPAPKSIGIGRFMSEIVNIQDRAGDTALMTASRIGNRSIISQLIEVGADTSIPNKSHLTPADFGVGDGTELEGRGDCSLGKVLGSDVKESSSDIISSITTLLTETEAEFTREMEKKQAMIDELHSKLRAVSGELGQRRRLFESLQAEQNGRETRNLKISNLTRAFDEERGKLSQVQQQNTQIKFDTEMELGDADKNFGISENATVALSKINLHTQQPLVKDPEERQILITHLPPAQTLRAQLHAYQVVNQALESSVQDLQKKDSELTRKYRKIIALCTGVDEQRVDENVTNLVRSLESEHDDIELGRVREFLSKVEGV